MPRLLTGQDVFQAAVERMCAVYEGNSRVVVSFSSGKDSGACLEVCLLAARMTGRLPVEVVMRDEELLFPGSFEYAERVAQRDDVSFTWLVPGHPVINVFNRVSPYWWTFDRELPPGDWMRQPPDFATKTNDLSVERMTIPERFPVEPGQALYAVMGLRVSES